MPTERIRVNDRKAPQHAQLNGMTPVWAGRAFVDGKPDKRPCLDVVTDDGRRMFVRFAPDGDRLEMSDTDVMRYLARRLLECADRYDGLSR